MEDEMCGVFLGCLRRYENSSSSALSSSSFYPPWSLCGCGCGCDWLDGSQDWKLKEEEHSIRIFNFHRVSYFAFLFHLSKLRPRLLPISFLIGIVNCSGQVLKSIPYDNCSLLHDCQFERESSSSSSLLSCLCKEWRPSEVQIELIFLLFILSVVGLPPFADLISSLALNIDIHPLNQWAHLESENKLAEEERPPPDDKVNFLRLMQKALCNLWSITLGLSTRSVSQSLTYLLDNSINRLCSSPTCQVVECRARTRGV